MAKNTENPAAKPVAVDPEKASETTAPATVEQPEVAGDTPPPDPEPNAATHEIAATPEKGFWRAGRHWPRAGLAVARADFTDDQWAALEAEPKLTIKPL